MKTLLFLMQVFPICLFGQMSKKDSIWLPLKSFIGQWAGEGGGEPGIGIYERSYQQILNNNYIEVRNKSSYKPTATNPKGEIHEDIGYFSFDKSQKKLKLR